MRLNKNDISENIVKGILFILATISILSVLIMTVFLFMTGGPSVLKVGIINFLFGSNWSPNETPPSYGILMFIIASVFGTAGAVIIGVPMGLLVAIFISKLAPTWMANIVRPLVDLLAGIPSVIYGFVGLLVLVPTVAKVFHLAIGANLFSAIIVLSVMVLPTIVSVSEASIRAVPGSLAEASLALGVSREYTIMRVIIPAARSGIIAAVLLGIGRAIGETMAVMMVSGNVPIFPTLFGPARFLTTGIVAEMSYASEFHRSVLIGIGLVLFVFILIINILFRHFMVKAGEKLG